MMSVPLNPVAAAPAGPGILKVSKIDQPKSFSRYMLPYQVAWVQDDSRLKMWEKSIRIGATWCQEFVAIRDRVRLGTDYLHSSVTENVALRFIEECDKFWLPIFGIAAQTRGEFYWDDAQTIKTFYIQFDNGAKILSFSSSPNALRGFGGDVGVDELAFHRDLDAMLAAAGGRAMWGHRLSLWSSHNGQESAWAKKLDEERRKPNSLWSIHRTTLPDAIEQGLVEKINAVSGANTTREQFVEQTISLVGGWANYQEECLCIPQAKGQPIIGWHDLVAAQGDRACTVVRIDGDAAEGDTMDPAALGFIHANIFAEFAGMPGVDGWLVGYDVARKGHLASISLLGRTSGRLRLFALVLMHNCKFRSQHAIAALAMRTLYAAGCGDSTGLGMQVCEDLTTEFGPSRFVGINFGIHKPALAALMQKNFEARFVDLPREPDYIAEDIFGLKTGQTPAGRQIVVESPNRALRESHCDIAWSIALAMYAGQELAANGPADGMLVAGRGSWDARQRADADDDDDDDDARLVDSRDRTGGHY